MRAPLPGVLPPRAVVRVTPSPPIAESERPVVLNRTSITPRPVQVVKEEGGSVVLENTTDKYAPYLLLVVDKAAHQTAGQVYDALREHFISSKKA